MYGALFSLRPIVHRIHYGDTTCTRPWTCWAHNLGPDRPRRLSKAQKSQWSHYGVNGKGETLPVNSNLAGEYNFPRKWEPGCPVLPRGTSLSGKSSNVGINFDATSTTLHSQLNTHLRITKLDLLSHSERK